MNNINLEFEIDNKESYDSNKFTGHKVELPIFSGPLDLLLYLIRRDEINIHDIPISKITGEFMNYLVQCEELNIELAAEFLVMASTLMEIKSKMLLPKPPIENLDDDDSLASEDPRAELVRKLLEYQQFKRAADSLREFEVNEKARFDRSDIVPSLEFEKPEADIYGNPNVLSLWQAVQELLDRAERQVQEIEGREIKRPRITIRQQMLHIIKLLEASENKKLSFLSIFTSADDSNEPLKYKVDIIVTFLALLELIRISRVIVSQKEVFSDIFIILR